MFNMIDEEIKKPLQPNELEVLTRMHVGFYFTPEGKTYISDNYWTRASDLHKRVVAAVLKELRKERSTNE
jgi:hypothetical protein